MPYSMRTHCYEVRLGVILSGRLCTLSLYFLTPHLTTTPILPSQTLTLRKSVFKNLSVNCHLRSFCHICTSFYSYLLNVFPLSQLN